MLVRVRVQFNPIKDEDWQAMHWLAARLTAEPDQIVVSEDEVANWLVVLFSMPTEPQYRALPKIESSLRLNVSNRWDSTFSFPLTEQERIRADRKLEQARLRRRAKRARLEEERRTGTG